MTIAGIRKRTVVSHFADLEAGRAVRNYYGFLLVSALLLAFSLSFLLLNLLLPDPRRNTLLARAYLAVYSSGFAAASLFLVFFLAIYGRRSARVVNLAAIIFSFLVIAFGVSLSTLDYFTRQNLAAILVAAVGVCAVLNAETWVYVLLEAWLSLLFAAAYAFVMHERAGKIDFAEVGFIAAVSLAFGVYLQRTREIADVLSLELDDRDRELKDALVRDRLTGAYNRIFIDEYLASQMRCIKRYGDAIAILLLDIDSFRVINEKLGRVTGDAALKEFVSIIVTHIRDSDLVARTGGEEFTVLLPRTSLDNALLVANKLKETVASSRLGTVPWQVTISAGVGMLAAGDTLETVFSRVDAALAAAKRAGRNRVEFVRPEDPIPPITDA